MSQTKWAEIPERGSLKMMILGIRLMNLCGYWIGIVGGFLAALYFFLTGSVSRRGSLTYLRRLNTWKPGIFTGEPGLKEAFIHHWNFAITVVDRFWFWQDRISDFSFTRVGREHMVAKHERGALLMGAHIGSFDAMRAFSAQKQVTINVIMYRDHARKVNAMLGELSPEADLRVIDLDGDDVNQIFELKERMEQGELVAILGDRPAPYGNPRLCEVPFLGRPASFPQNPWILASLLDCPVFTALGVRTGPKSYHIMVEPLADRIVLPRKTRQESVKAYMEQYVARLERVCEENPYQWFNFYDFWSKKEC